LYPCEGFPFSDPHHPTTPTLKEAVIELGTWRDEPGLETLVGAVREAWMDYVAGSGIFEIPRADEKLADVIPLRKPRNEPPE
jgi:hypothetical protein